MTHPPRSGPRADLVRLLSRQLPRLLSRLLPLAFLLAMNAPEAGAKLFPRTVWVEKFGYAA